MIKNYLKFNESTKPIWYYDRIIAYGGLKFWGDDGQYNVDIDGQTGRVASVKGGGYNMVGIVFNNYFFNQLTDLDKILKFKRGLWIGLDQCEKVVIEKPRIERRPLSFSDKAKKVFEHCEYIDCPLFLDIDYIDVTDKNDTISYITRDRLERLEYDDDQWDNKLRQEMKVGKLIMMITPNTNQVSLEKKISLFKSAHNAIVTNKSTFKIVKGDEIGKWYNEDSYQEGTGQLNKSCMRDKMDRLSVYYSNPDKISMLILLNEDNKLVGRALVWKVDEPEGVTYMDRIYTVYSEDVHRFEDYARQHGWKYFEMYKYTDMKVYFNYDLGTDEENPYMDTFTNYYSDIQCLTNKYIDGHQDDSCWMNQHYDFTYV
jgi:hypothetical protein